MLTYQSVAGILILQRYWTTRCVLTSSRGS